MEYYSVKLEEQGTIAVDDTILVKGAVASAGSHILEGYKPLFSAEAVDRLEAKGYKLSGKTHVGEFGLDLAGEFSYYAKPEGTIKGAAAELVAGGGAEAALGVDLNGAPRRAAALSGVSFLKPTYGTVSRYGIIACADSGEQMGVYAKDAAKIAEIMHVIAGMDEKDGTSLRTESYAYPTDLPVAGRRVCIIRELLAGADEATRARIYARAQKLQAQDVIVEEIDADWIGYAKTAWQILMTAETCNNVSRYDGVKFGFRAEQFKDIDELYVNTRTEGFNFLTKAVILYGSDVLSQHRYSDCYGKCLKVRRVIAEKFAALMEEYDAVLAPACSKTAYEPYDIEDAFETVFKEQEYTAIANLIGVPALTTGGVQLIGDTFGEGTLLSLAASIEKAGE